MKDSICIEGVYYGLEALKRMFILRGKELISSRETIQFYVDKNEELKHRISELETELRVKEDLLKIQSGLKNGEFSEIVEIDGEYKKLTHTESGAVKISNLPYKEESRPSIEWYEDRHQSDCITINQLHTTIDVLTDKLTNLRKNMGLC